MTMAIDSLWTYATYVCADIWKSKHSRLYSIKSWANIRIIYIMVYWDALAYKNIYTRKKIFQKNHMNEIFCCYFSDFFKSIYERQSFGFRYLKPNKNQVRTETKGVYFIMLRGLLKLHNSTMTSETVKTVNKSTHKQHNHARLKWIRNFIRFYLNACVRANACIRVVTKFSENKCGLNFWRNSF